MDIPAIWVLAKPIVEGQIRTALAGLAGSLATVGAIQGSDKTAFVSIGTGIAMYAIPAVWSWWDKIGRARVLAAVAKMNPVAAKSATTGEAVKAAVDAVSVAEK